ncbi:MAG: hypothetical protein HYZ22_04555 [Chloroflexi bacterium]|nr:hypothetical protein [Chloroflexota bacterium]
MKKAHKIDPKDYDDGMLPEYDFKGKKGMRGKYYIGPNQAHTVHIHHEDGSVTIKHFDSLQKVITLDPDVSVYFPDSESVNNALRVLITLIPQKQIGETKTTYKTRKKSRKKTAARK